MSIIRKLIPHVGEVPTSLAGVEDSDCPYEIVGNMLILRTSTSDTIHIIPDIGKQLVSLIENNIL